MGCVPGQLLRHIVAHGAMARYSARMRNRLWSITSQTLLAVTCLLALAQPVPAQVSGRDAEIAQCLPGEMVTWGDSQDRAAVSSPMVFVYDHTAAPAWFDENLVLSALRRAAAHWSQCGVPAAITRSGNPDAATPHAITVRWSDLESRGNFGLTHFAQRTLTLGPAAFGLLRTRNPAHDARETLQMVISHEMGHLFGLMAHSRRCVDVTSNYDNGQGEKCQARDRTELLRFTEYRSTLPTACDIQRCRMLNGIRGNP